jgi:hypothetical protein
MQAADFFDIQRRVVGNPVIYPGRDQARLWPRLQQFGSGAAA